MQMPPMLTGCGFDAEVEADDGHLIVDVHKQKAMDD
jgi:hypothetical protein